MPLLHGFQDRTEGCEPLPKCQKEFRFLLSKFRGETTDCPIDFLDDGRRKEYLTGREGLAHRVEGDPFSTGTTRAIGLP